MVSVRASKKSRGGVIIFHFHNKVSRCVWPHGREYLTMAGAIKTFNYLSQQDFCNRQFQVGAGAHWWLPTSPLSSSSCSLWSSAGCLMVATWLLQLQASPPYPIMSKTRKEEGRVVENSFHFYQEAKHFLEAPEQTSFHISLARTWAHGHLQQQYLENHSRSPCWFRTTHDISPGAWGGVLTPWTQGLCTSYQSKTQVQCSINKEWGYGGVGQYLSHVMNKCHMYDPHMLIWLYEAGQVD